MTTRRRHPLIPETFEPVPGLHALAAVDIALGDTLGDIDVIAVGVSTEGEVPILLGLDRAALSAAGFDGKPGQSLLLPRADGPDLLAVGLSEAEAPTVDELRDAAATAVRATGARSRLALSGGLTREHHGATRSAAITALVEGALLANYRYTELAAESTHVRLTRLVIDDTTEQDRPAAQAATVSARPAVVARDLANTPPGHLTATDLANIAVDLGAQFGFDVEVSDQQRLIELGCGGLLGVNQGSAEEPRMVVLRYRPDGTPRGRLGLIGKGIMYDSGGISLKPSDPMHLLMKMDMGGAAAVLGAFTALRDAGVESEVVGWLMCTDNMPSGTAYKLGDVLTARGGTTIEVKNTDAEGRLVMSDAFVLATEERVDAIVDIATLTGAALVSLGGHVAALLGNDERMIEQVRRSSAASDEQVWQLPLVTKYRSQLDSDIADIANLGGPFAGTITAALFLEHFTAGTPWAHLDIAGTMQVEKDDSWRTRGATGFGARLLLDLAAGFEPPVSS